MASLTIREVSKWFGKRAGSHPPAVSDVNLDVASGELLVLLGASGSGKTTLLRCIAGLVKPSSGRISVGDRTLVDARIGIDIPPHKRHLAMVFQNFALWPHMTVRDNVAFPLRAQGAGSEIRAGRVNEVLQTVRCLHLAGRLPATLSGGEQQRVALARALVSRPALVLLDEPLSNLDAILRLQLRGELGEIHRMTGFTGVYVTHDQTEALALGSRIAVMNEGRIQQVGTPEEIYGSPATEYVAEFVGLANSFTLNAANGQWLGDDGRNIRLDFIAKPTVSRTLVVRCRPEHVVLQPPGGVPTSKTRGSETLTLPGCEVIGRHFLGERTEYTLRSGGIVLKSRPNGAHGLFGVGDRVTAEIDEKRLAIFENDQRVDF
jgi:iron(III) transport system ATP-binding protein